MIKYLQLITLSILSFSCSQPTKYEKITLLTLEQRVTQANKLNAELSRLTSNSTEIRTLSTNMLDTITLLENYLIASTGGYREGFDGLKRELINAPVDSYAELNRNNPFHINKNYLNRISEFVTNQGLEFNRIATEPSDDPYWAIDPNFKDKDYFDVAFQVDNIYQVLAHWNHIKLNILNLERTFLQHQLKNN